MALSVPQQREAIANHLWGSSNIIVWNLAIGEAERPVGY